MKTRTILFLSVLTILISIILVDVFSTKPKHPYAGLNVEQLIQKYGYPAEVHEVVTKDGYILTLQRIPQPNEETKKKTPVLLLHGAAHSAWDFVHYGPNQSLCFLLWQKGFDVWLGNVRGTKWSRKHKYLDPDNNAYFWDFSVDEIAKYDIPAFIDYVLEVTQEESLHYVGYSQGTMVFFILNSELTEYNTKIKSMSALSPVVFTKNSRSLIVNFLAKYWKFEDKYLDFWEFFTPNNPIQNFLTYICNENSIFSNLCLHHIFIIYGYSDEEYSKDILSLTFSNSPTGVSKKQMLHLFQMFNSGDCQKYDYGDDNIKIYGQEKPPTYDLSKVTAPVALYYAKNDWIVAEENIDRLVATLPNVIKKYEIPSKTFSHYDFVNSINVSNLLYNTVVEEIMKYEKK